MNLRDLDPLLNNPKRLAALGVCSAAARVNFGFVRDHLGLNDSDTSKQMKALCDRGYVTTSKTGAAANRRTWFSATSTGRTALKNHMAALNALVLSELPPPTPPGSGS